MEKYTMSQTAKDFKPGFYKHFKGGIYQALGISVHTETLEEFVLYIDKSEENPVGYWVRPLEMFLGEKDLPDGSKVKRFEYLGENYKPATLA